jgi:hypothetical protein
MVNVLHRKIWVIAIVVVLLLTTISGISMARGAGERNETLAADVVLQWNGAVLEMIKRKNISNQFGNRTMAMLHIAMFDAVNGNQMKYTPFFNIDKPPQSVSPQVAAAAAAYTILSSLYPAEQEIFEALYHGQLSGLQRNPGLDRLAVQYGEKIANTVLEWRENDGSAEAASVPYPDGTEPGEWRRTPPSFAAPMLPGWGQVTPFVMTGADQFRLIGPPPMDSYEYARDFNEVKDMGAKNSLVRTAEQTQIARFWPTGIPRMWNLVARELVEQNQYDLIDSARLFALLNITLADANLMAWDMKYYYGFWRPITAIEYADDDGNDSTTSDSGWESLIPAPAFPEYVSGHSTACASAATLLAKLNGNDGFHFELTSEANPALPSRSYSSFWEAAREAGISRVYGGIHFNFSNVEGLEAGRSLGRYVFEQVMTPLSKEQQD